jgi:hypothetical protein
MMVEKHEVLLLDHSIPVGSVGTTLPTLDFFERYRLRV